MPVGGLYTNDYAMHLMMYYIKIEGAVILYF